MTCVLLFVITHLEMQTMFAFLIADPGTCLDGSEIHIRAVDEADAERLAGLRSKMISAPLRRAVDRDVVVRDRGAA